MVEYITVKVYDLFNLGNEPKLCKIISGEDVGKVKEKLKEERGDEDPKKYVGVWKAIEDYDNSIGSLPDKCEIYFSGSLYIAYK
ncbi:hypothetical protein FBU31_005355 [Coemansia sp. 'formosensis']|nr:hypothetical protein FBU31_005355 [Coemansia sp. 'formosensis']